MHLVVAGLNSKLTLLEFETQVKGKVRKAYCEAGVVAGNGLLAFVRFVLFPIRTLLADRAAAAAGAGRGGGEGGMKANFTVCRREENGGDVVYYSAEDVEQDYAAQRLHALDLKLAVETAVNALLLPVREVFEADPHLLELRRRAYPEAPGAGATDGTGAMLREDDFRRLDLRVGQIVNVGPHATADGLYVGKGDVGDAGVREFVSGTAKFLRAETLMGARVVTVCNVQPVTIKGVASTALVVCASGSRAGGEGGAGGFAVELLRAPEESAVGERVSAQGYCADSSEVTFVWMNRRRSVGCRSMR